MKVNIKWGKETFKDIELNETEPPLLFKAQLYALTGVQPERQKVIFKGKTLADENWEGFPGCKNGALLMMMGSADAVPTAPVKQVQFADDDEDEDLRIPAGLQNLGNTCYMNSALQCLKTVPELKLALHKFSGSLSPTEMPQAITAAIRDLYDMMDSKNRSSDEIVPLVMVQVLHMAYPQFAEKDEHGRPQQQDANECWFELLRQMQQKLTPLPAPTSESGGGIGTDEATGESSSSSAGATASAPSAGTGSQRSAISQYFEGTMSVKLTCKENPEEPPSFSTESFLQLRCYLQDVKYMFSGLKSFFVGELEKRSPSLDRNSVYDKEALVTRLPAYLTIQMMRFSYKEKKNISAKMLKDIKFGINLDMYDFCSPELKQKLVKMREKFKEKEDKEAEIKLEKDSEENIARLKNLVSIPFDFSEDPGSNNSGYYELQAVLTHKGRYSNSGHYIAWVRNMDARRKNRGRKGTLVAEWLKCDDDVVMGVSEEDILRLSGGGDWHCAYVLLYGPKILEIEPGSTDATKSDTTEDKSSKMEDS